MTLLSDTKMRGWRGRVGIVSPDDGIVDDEYWQFIPEGVRNSAISPENG